MGRELFQERFYTEYQIASANGDGPSRLQSPRLVGGGAERVAASHVMGLDIVELVMAVEEEFGIEIPTAAAPKLAVLGDMHDYIVRALGRRGDTPDEGQLWERLSAVVVKQLGVHPDEVRRSAHIVHDLRAD